MDAAIYKSALDAGALRFCPSCEHNFTYDCFGPRERYGRAGNKTVTLAKHCNACTSAAQAARDKKRREARKQGPHVEIHHTGPEKDSIEYRFFCT
jgi:hypothetical protein